ncbi:linear amide C-N hydrolase [Microbulbifer harenosus]|uniref:Linear amide C-N hydrolase n=1 Tax=Microbulbifer harenosus TaxID=2576840 RepID=A0ABY2ULM3_9GAMM|nr:MULTISPECIES: linear amide C-N hydrolase [Microbulbifer]QIL91127.1 linear amide C-N hydrolase [Microbulbifer sp. SH-1]TLM79348.1 linear amide C-N hydrolase [Microbulbifer harenosus]
MCTRTLWLESGQGPIAGRNMDWAQSLGTNLWVLPAGAERTGIDKDPNPLKWKSKHASLVATAYDLATVDGLNEKGLATHVLWLTESDYGERDPAQLGLSVSLWAQFYLDQFDSVEACVAYTKKHQIQVRPQGDPVSGRWSTVHLALSDATGDSAVIEYIDGVAKVHHSRKYTVMTNSPPFDQQLQHLAKYQGLGGDLPLPGTTEAADRFVRASYYLSKLPPADSPRQAYAALLSVMRNAAQPFGVADPARPHISMTIWRTLIDLKRGVYAFESSFSPDIIWVQLHKLDLSKSQKLDLSQEDLVGDVSGRFVATPAFAFMSA